MDSCGSGFEDMDFMFKLSGGIEVITLENGRIVPQSKGRIREPPVRFDLCKEDYTARSPRHNQDRPGLRQADEFDGLLGGTARSPVRDRVGCWTFVAVFVDRANAEHDVVL